MMNYLGWIGVFYTNDLDDLIYVGGTDVNGDVTSIAAWGSEAGLDNGFAPGEEYIYGIIHPTSFLDIILKDLKR